MRQTRKVRGRCRMTRRSRHVQSAGDPLLFAATTKTITDSVIAPALRAAASIGPMQPTYIPPHASDPPCHPAIIKESRTTGACLTASDIELLRNKWNSANPATAIPKTDAQTTRKRMSQVMKERAACTSEFCWINQPFVGGENTTRLRKRFRTPAPQTWKKEPTTWLDSNNIYSCLEQLAEVYPWFETIYPPPIDFDKRIYDSIYNGECVTNELCNLDVDRDLKRKGKTAFGIIFNLDPHDKPGSHWVALYIDLGGHERPAGAYYWDSYGIHAPTRIRTLMKRIQDQEGGPTKFILRENDIRHQRKETECGMYSLYFIISMLEGRDFEDITNNVVDDDMINRMRYVYFAS